MGDKKMQMKKIANPSARKVSFSKRRRGLFKKAEELSILCDAEVAIIILSTGKLVQYSSCRMNEILQRHRLHSKKLGTMEGPSSELQPAETEHSILSREVAEKSVLLREMRGEDLRGMNIEELEQLEESLENGLSRLIKKKAEKMVTSIESLQQQGMQLREEKNRRRHQGMEICGGAKLISADSQSDGPSSVSGTTSARPPHDYESLDTSLQLGLNY